MPSACLGPCLEAKEAGNKMKISGVFYNLKPKNVDLLWLKFP